jgi:hypothetical protein
VTAQELAGYRVDMEAVGDRRPMKVNVRSLVTVITVKS